VVQLELGSFKRDEGFKWLDKAYEVRDRWLCFLKVDPLFERVRSEQKFKALLKKWAWINKRLER